MRMKMNSTTPAIIAHCKTPMIENSLNNWLLI
jgi:hypothetical protein